MHAPIRAGGTYATGIYTHVLDRWGIVYDQPIVLNERQAGVAIEGVERHDFRREIHTLLSRGESVHQLQRAIYTGKVAPERGRRRDEMKAISGSLALLTNIVLAWNTSRMNDTVERMRKDGLDIDDARLRRIGPGHFAHINFRGTFRFRIEAYASALLRQSTTSRASATA